MKELIYSGMEGQREAVAGAYISWGDLMVKRDLIWSPGLRDDRRSGRVRRSGKNPEVLD